jgi:hypothetical protein
MLKLSEGLLRLRLGLLLISLQVLFIHLRLRLADQYQRLVRGSGRILGHTLCGALYSMKSSSHYN